jgi:hypothetical protein
MRTDWCSVHVNGPPEAAGPAMRATFASACTTLGYFLLLCQADPRSARRAATRFRARHPFQGGRHTPGLVAIISEIARIVNYANTRVWQLSPIPGLGDFFPGSAAALRFHLRSSAAFPAVSLPSLRQGKDFPCQGKETSLPHGREVICKCLIKNALQTATKAPMQVFSRIFPAGREFGGSTRRAPKRLARPPHRRAPPHRSLGCCRAGEELDPADTRPGPSYTFSQH